MTGAITDPPAKLRSELHTGDCLDIMLGLPAGSVDAIITDLPYGTTACAWDTVIPFEPLWAEVRRLLKPQGIFVTTAAQPFTSYLVTSNPKWFRYAMVWIKNRATGFLDANRRPLNNIEDILVFAPGRHTYTPQMTTGVRHKRGGKRRPSPNTHYRDFNEPGPTWSDQHYPTRTLEIPVVRLHTAHPTQKPQALAEYLIRTYTNRGDLVLDPCMGSGTTGLAALATGRRFIGIEKDHGYAALAAARIAQAVTPAQPPLLAL